MPDGRSGNCVYCPECGTWRHTEIVRYLPSGYEKDENGNRVWVSRCKYKCGGCKHKWTSVTKIY